MNPKKKKRLAYLVSEYPAISHTFIYREIKCLREKGFEVNTISVRLPTNPEVLSEEERKEIQETFYVKAWSVYSIFLAHLTVFFRSPHRYLRMITQTGLLRFKGPIEFLKAIGYFLEAGVILDWLWKREITHLHVHFANPAATVALIASETGWISFSLSVHGPDEFFNIQTNLLTEKFLKAKGIRCISYFCQSQVQRLLPVEHWKKCTVVRCGVDLDVFTAGRDKQPDIPEILCVGRLTPSKAQAVLLTSCQILKQREILFHVTLVGEGPDRKYLEELVKSLGLVDRVTFAGAVGQHRILSYYDSATVFVLPSFAEGLPVVLMEAMAKEIPCVATPIAGIPELIEHHQTGLLVPPSDPVGLANAIELLIKDVALRERLGKAAREKVLQEYDLKKNCEDMARFLESLLDTLYCET